MKVLFVHNGLGTGGAERSLAELLAYLRAHDVTAVVACLYRRAEGVQAEVVSAGHDIRYLPAGAPARVRALRRLIAELRPDLVHTTIYEADLAGRLAAIGGPPVLSSLVNTSYAPARLEADPNVRRWSLTLARLVDGWTARHLNAGFHAISQTVADAAVQALGIRRERITVIPRGRDLERLGRPSPARRQSARAALGIADDAEVVVNVARREYQKGQRYLLDAVATLLAARPRLVVLIAGRDGHASSALERQHRELGLGDRVPFLGHRDDVADLLAAADLFVFPSLFEGLGGALIEAMALGLPIAASDLPVLREVVEPGANADLVPPAAPDELAVAIADLLDDAGRRRRYGARSLQIYEQHFTAERAAAGMLALYRRMTGLQPDNLML